MNVLFIVKPISQKGHDAIKQHLSEKKKLPFKVRFTYNSLIKEELNDEGSLCLSFKKDALAFIMDLNKFEAELMRTMALNGAERTLDYELIRGFKDD